MKIACINQGSNQPFEIASHLEQAFLTCREAVGHLPVANIYSCTKEEALVNAAPDVFALFGDEGIDISLLLCKDLSQTFPAAALLVFVTSDHYKLRTLARFEILGAEVFSLNEPPVRIVHRIAQLQTKKQQDHKGKLITIVGVKGGVGATTYTTGLAHALQAFDKSTVVIDLSPSGALLHYINTPKWYSSDYAAALTNNIFPDDALVSLSLTTAPNGINALLPPLGDIEIRELWLRDAKSFEVTLAMIDILRAQFGYVIVDIASAEGILPFALISRSDFTLLVSSNDPASVHLLNSKIHSLTGIPGNTNLQIIINLLSRRGLMSEDITDFLYANPKFNPDMLSLPLFHYDQRGNRWIGTGNTIYTEGNKKTRSTFDATARFFESLKIETEESSIKTKLLELLQRKALPKPNHLPLYLPYAQHNQNQAAINRQPLTSPLQIERYSFKTETPRPLFCKIHRSNMQLERELSDRRFSEIKG